MAILPMSTVTGPIFFMAICFALSTSSVTTCPSRCICHGISVSCTGGNLSEIPVDLPPTTQFLYIDQNAISVVRKGAFSQMTDLEVLNLEHNRLKEIDEGAFDVLHNLASLNLNSNNLSFVQGSIFSPLTNLTVLSLNDNAFEKISTGTFAALRSLTQLYLESNRAHLVIEAGAFSGLSNLTHLSLASSRLLHLSPGTFEGLSNLQSLDLSSNQIEVIEKGGFSLLPNLVNLSMSGNKIVEVPVHAFQDKQRLSQIMLEFNRIRTLNESLFDGSPNLKSLLLNDNKLESLPAGIFDSITTPLEVTLRNNPLVCDCHLDWIIPWLQRRAGMIDRCVCAQPPALHGLHVGLVKYDKFHCEPMITDGTTAYEAVSGDRNITMVCPVYGKPPPSIEWTTPTDQVISKNRPSDSFLVSANGSLVVLEVSAADEGQFTCNARNSLGHVLIHVDLIVDLSDDTTSNSNSWVVPLLVLFIVAVILGVIIFSPKCCNKDCLKRKMSTRYGQVLRYNPLDQDNDSI